MAKTPKTDTTPDLDLAAAEAAAAEAAAAEQAAADAAAAEADAAEAAAAEAAAAEAAAAEAAAAEAAAAAADAPAPQADPGDETDNVLFPVLDFGATVTEPDWEPEPVAASVPGAFPTVELMLGHRARRTIWAPGYELMVAEAGGRSGARLKLMTTGSRSGPIEWKPAALADELLAQDWLVVPTVEPLP